MDGFIEHKGSFWKIQGHVLIVQDRDINQLLDHVAPTLVLPWAFSDEGEYYQLSHPLSAPERDSYAWLYHRMAAMQKEVDNEPEPPHTPPPQAA